ncbi:hypothetical protein CR513_12769, partial [Mucuna pruriens]
MTKSVVTKFIKRVIICRYGLLAHIITGNGTNLNNKLMIELCEQFKIKHHNSTPYCPKMNEALSVQGRGLGTQEEATQRQGPAWQVGSQLRGTICSQASILRRSLGTSQFRGTRINPPSQCKRDQNVLPLRVRSGKNPKNQPPSLQDGEVNVDRWQGKRC